MSSVKILIAAAIAATSLTAPVFAQDAKFQMPEQAVQGLPSPAPTCLSLSKHLLII